MADTQPQPLQGQKGAATGAAAAPSATPPKMAVSARAGVGVAAAGTVWNNSQTVNALWSINEDRNSWFGAAGVGWVKLSTASDTGVIALTELAAHAYQTQHIINYRTEADGMCHEIYAW